VSAVLEETGSDVRAGDADAACFHCGLPIKERGRYRTVVRGAARGMCCAGCEAVASAIVANGLEAWYDHRSKPGARPEEAVPRELRDLTVFDDPGVQSTFVTATAGAREASLLMEGLQCPACVWLNETHVHRLPGVLAFEINYTTRRARVRWDDSRVRLSAILAAIEAIGYRAQPYDSAAAEASRKAERRTALWRLFVAGFGMMQVMMYAVPAYMAGDGDMPADLDRLMRLASLALTVPVVAYAALPFFTSAWRDLARRRLGMDVPVTIGIAVTFVASAWNTVVVDGPAWFDSVTMFVFFLLGGRYLELVARHRAARVIEELADRQPATAERLVAYPADRTIERVAASRLVPGDFVLVKAGAIVPADGAVAEGRSTFDEALLTGESRPVERAAGSRLIGGSVNASSAIVMRVERVGADTWLAGIGRLIDRASRDRPRLVQLAERYAGAFVGVILLLALVAVVAWWPVSPARGIEAAIAVLVVTCPCALSLATPLALSAATASLARQGVLVAAPDALERIATLDRLAMDKTGTLTIGAPRLLGVRPLAERSAEACVAIAARLDAHAAHPIARALREAAPNAGTAATHTEEHPAAGVEGLVDGRRYRLGTIAFSGALHRRVLAADALAGDDTRTLAALSDESGFLAILAFGDEPRAEARSTVDALASKSVVVSILSGDRASAVHALARTLGIAEAAGDLAQAKRERLLAMQRAGHVVGMVGDGVNDAPVLAQAHVSFALAGGAPLAQVRADVVLLGDRLDGIVTALVTAERARRIVRQNLGWAFAYNVAAVPLAALGLVPAWLASLGMAVSSLAVVANSVRLLPGAGERR
jgi:Cu2+-exporting ATPase